MMSHWSVQISKLDHHAVDFLRGGDMIILFEFFAAVYFSTVVARPGFVHKVNPESQV